MNLLNYTSKEMFSSTELIRKSKTIFDKVNKKEIEKAIILRDGKPAFMLLDFETYEKLMADYIEIKENENKKGKVSKNVFIKEEIVEKVIEQEKPIEENILLEDKKTFDSLEAELNDADLENALAEIEKLDMSIKPTVTEKEKSIKEFWD